MLAFELAIPSWLAVIGLIAAMITSLGVIWFSVLKPLFKFIAVANDLVPLLLAFNEDLKGTKSPFKVLNEIIAQFRSDSGSTLRDVVNRLEESAIKGSAVSEALRVDIRSAKELAALDRTQTLRLMMQLDRLEVRMDNAKIEREQISTAVNTIIEDVDASHRRASETTAADPGAAADASARLPE